MSLQHFLHKNYKTKYTQENNKTIIVKIILTLLRYLCYLYGLGNSPVQNMILYESLH